MADGDKHDDWWAPASVVRQAVSHASERAVATWGDVQYADNEEDGQGLKLLEYWRILYKHKWLMVAVVLAALAVGVAVTLLTKPIYTAATTLEIDRESPNVVGLQDAQPVEPVAQDQDFIQTQYGLLKSRSLSERVVQSLGLGSDNSFFTAMGVRPHGDPGARARQAVSLVQDGLGVAPDRDSRLVKVTFDSPSAVESARISNAFGANFIQSNLERRFQASAYARQFLEQHLAEIKSRLEDSERRLVAYATAQGIIQLNEPGQGTGPGQAATPTQSLAATDLTGLDAALTAANANLVQMEQRWRAAQAAPELAAPDVLGDPTVQALRQERAKLAEQYTQQLKLYKPDYPDMVQLKAQIADIDSQLKTAADTIRGSLHTQYLTALQQQSALQGKVNRLKGNVLDERKREIQYNILQREVDTDRTLYDGLLQRYKDIGVAGGVTSNNISIVDPAQPPDKPSKPQPLRNLALAGGSGLLLAAMLAFLLETLDQAIRKPADVEAKLGLPLLGAVPLLDNGVQPMEALADVRSPFSEAYHSIRGVLGFSTKDGVPRVLSITSARPEEGKSTTAMALAQGFARLGLQVVLVDLDLRNPSQHKLTGADNRQGASTFLTAGAGLDEVVQPTAWPNLFLVPSGPLPPSATELLSGQRLMALTRQASERFDIVIIDGPPVMGLADAPLISSVADGTILTVEAGMTGRGQAQAAIRRLKMAHVHLLGVVLTKFDPRTASSGYSYAYAYEYDYSYGGDKAEDRKLGRRRGLLPEQDRKRTPAA